MYSTIEELINLADERGVGLWQVILDSECEATGKTREQVLLQAKNSYEVMLQSASRALETPLPTAGNLITGIANTQAKYNGTASISGEFINMLMARALSCSETNAAMGKVCAAPTAGACGILPAVLISIGERFDLSEDEILQGLLTASGIGAVIMSNATVSGAEGGCQAECGTAAAMAAAAAVQMAGGTNRMMGHAVGFAFMNCMGLVCDPVGGLVQVPCAVRNAGQAVNAVTSADLALSGNCCMIPADEMVEAMLRVGRMLPPALRETADGGAADTPTARRFASEFYQS